MQEWTKDKEKKVLWKYRFLLTIRIIRVIFILLFIYAIYMMILSIIYDQTNWGRKQEFQMKLALDWTQDGNYGEVSEVTSGKITPFLSQKIEFPLYQTIGKEEQPVGTVKMKKTLFNSFSNYEINYLNPSDSKRFTFYLPEDPRTGKTIKLSDTPEVWDTLDKIHEGTVANLAFSTTSFLKPEELLKQLENVDVDVLWMPLYAGELKSIKKVDYTESGNGNVSVETLGLSWARKTDDYQSSSLMKISKETISDNEKIMLANMKNLLDHESDTYIDRVLGLSHLEKRYNYVKENGFQVYGAVVTGPVKELLKLKNFPFIQGAELGKFEYWNWER
ncbi:anti-sigma factor [Heyndrickxia oleronia]|uniref:anti-sigma factor n=1 Tax=Heyndrickxia oleronia TaxID=38875 RepID=UPI00203CD4FE|nr:anti-sigma factor [Heyndrickxia oleronia]MCM3455223.1 anti-sigma factor [Heyndrickxia oleronia]